jgi:flagellar hook-length control protein FliK
MNALFAGATPLPILAPSVDHVAQPTLAAMLEGQTSPSAGDVAALDFDLSLGMELQAEPESIDDASSFADAVAPWMGGTLAPMMESALIEDAFDESSVRRVDGDVLERLVQKPALLAVSSPRQEPLPVPLAQLSVLASDSHLQHSPLGAHAPARANGQAAANTLLRHVAPAEQGGERAELRAATPVVRAPQPEVAVFGVNAAPSSSVRVEGIVREAKPMLDETSQHKLLGALGERIHVQARQGMQHAVIDLAPYMAGKVRIELHHEAGALQVRISASNAEVTQQLQAISESLRQELNGRQFNDVAVQIGPGRHAEHGGRGQDGESPHRQQPGRALAGDEADEAFADAWRGINESRGNQA